MGPSNHRTLKAENVPWLSYKRGWDDRGKKWRESKWENEFTHYCWLWRWRKGAINPRKVNSLEKQEKPWVDSKQEIRDLSSKAQGSWILSTARMSRKWIFLGILRKTVACDTLILARRDLSLTSDLQDYKIIHLWLLLLRQWKVNTERLKRVSELFPKILQVSGPTPDKLLRRLADCAANYYV